MIKADKLKLQILSQLKKSDMSLGQLRKVTKIAHHHTLLNALEFLKTIDMIEIKPKRDKLKTKMVRLK